MNVQIVGTGSQLPKKIVSNDDLSKIMDTSDEWIVERTGIKNRHLVEEETTTSMSVDAAKKAVTNAQINPEDLDLIIVATVSPDYCFPSTACEIQSALGATHATAFDINAACSGFLFGLQIAKTYIETGIAKCALIIGAETLSKMIDWNDRSTCVLFGDGAGAAVLKQSDHGIISMVQGSDGSRGMALSCKNRPVNHPFVKNDLSFSYAQMNGQEVYRFAVRTVPACIEEALEKAGKTSDDIKFYILHQANIRIIESVAKRLCQPIEKFPTNLQKCGNISAGSIPILLDEIRLSGQLKEGDLVVLSGFGAGLTWGAAVIEW